MTAYLAPALAALRRSIDVAAPGRDRGMDGWIGDPAHQARVSDHNPRRDPPRAGMVCAIDVTDDDIGPAGSAYDATALWQRLLATRPGQVKYLIHRGRIARAYDRPGIPAWTPARYDGQNAHYGHLHISVWGDSRAEDTDWTPLEGDDMTPDQDRLLRTVASQATQMIEIFAQQVVPALTALTVNTGNTVQGLGVRGDWDASRPNGSVLEAIRRIVREELDADHDPDRITA